MNKIGRPTLDKKDQTLKLRLNDEMRWHVEQQAYYSGISMSEYVRELIKDDMTFIRDLTSKEEEVKSGL